MFPHIDNFNRADATTLGPDWLIPGGGTTWQIVGNRAKCFPGGGGGNAFPVAIFYRDFENVALGTDYQVKAKLWKPISGTVGICGRVRWNGTSNGFQLYLAAVRTQAGTDNIQLYHFTADGVFVQLGSTVTEEWTDGDTLILRMQGDQISVYRDSGGGPVLKIQVTDGASTYDDVSGTMGMRSTGDGQVDDLTMEFIPGVKNLVNHQVGHVTDVAARVAFAISESAAVKVEYSTAINFAASIITSAVNVDSTTDFTGKIDIAGLLANTQYYFRVLVDDIIKNVDRIATPIPKFKTYPAYGNVNFSFVFGSCVENINRGHDYINGETNFATIIGKSFAFWHCGGDNYYSDHTPDVTLDPTLAKYRARARMSLTVALYHRSFKKLMTQRPTYRMWDDHEVINDWNPTDHAAYVPNASQAFNEHVGRCNPNPYRAGVKYYAFKYGNVGFFSTDGRSFRSRQNDPDNASKTYLGATQLQDLKDWLVLNNDEHRIKFIINPTPINGHTSHATVNDAFGEGYVTELRELFDFIRTNDIGGVVFLSSDQHWSGAFRRVSDSIGSSQGIGFYEFQATPYGAFIIAETPDVGADILFKDDSTASNHGFVTVDTTLANPTVQFQVFNQANALLGSVTITESEINQGLETGGGGGGGADTNSLAQDRYWYLWKLVDGAGGTPSPGDSETVLLQKYLTAIGGTPVPGDDFNILLRKVVILKGGTPTPGDNEWNLLVKWLQAEGECRACGDSVYDLWRKILEMQESMEPEVRVQQEDDLGAMAIADDQADAIDFGSLMEGGEAVSITFTVFNDGDVDLTLGAVSVPSGYTLTEGLSGTITPGNSDSFTVRLDTGTPGVKAGNISFSTNDADENPFNFPVTGTIIEPLMTNLISHWRLDEASGGRVDAHDGNNLTDVNTVGQAVGKIGNAASFIAGNQEALSVADNPTLSMGDIDFTIAVWVWVDNAGSMGIVGKSGGGSREYVLQSFGGAFYFTVSADGAGASQLVSSGGHGAGAWHFVVAWHDAAGDTINIQVNNGTPTSLAHVGGAYNGNATLYVGLYELGLEYLSGRVDSLSIWKRLLTAGERTSLYNSGTGLDYPF